MFRRGKCLKNETKTELSARVVLGVDLDAKYLEVLGEISVDIAAIPNVLQDVFHVDVLGNGAWNLQADRTRLEWWRTSLVCGKLSIP